MTKRPIQIVTYDLLFTFLILLANIMIIAERPYGLVRLESATQLEDFHAVRKVSLPPSTSRNYALLVVPVWLKFINFFHATRTVGPLLKIINKMAQDIFNFLTLACLVILLFSCVGLILFFRNGKFMSFGDALVTLYSWMLGDFSFDDMADEGLKGSIFMAVYLLISLVLLLNLLIAVLSSTFAQLESHGVGLYLQSLIDEFPRYSYHPTLNFLTFHSPPFQFLSLIFLSCAKRRASKCATVLEAVYYIPLFLMVLAGIVIVDVAIFPFAYYAILETKWKTAKALHFFLYLLLFPLSFPIILLLDLGIACGHLWSSPSRNTSFKKKRLQSSQQYGLLKKDFETMELIISGHYSGKQDPVLVSEVVRHIRDELPFTCNYSDFAAIVTSFYPDALQDIPQLVVN